MLACLSDVASEELLWRLLQASMWFSHLRLPPWRPYLFSSTLFPFPLCAWRLERKESKPIAGNMPSDCVLRQSSVIRLFTFELSETTHEDARLHTTLILPFPESVGEEYGCQLCIWTSAVSVAESSYPVKLPMLWHWVRLSDMLYPRLRPWGSPSPWINGCSSVGAYIPSDPDFNRLPWLKIRSKSAKAWKAPNWQKASLLNRRWHRRHQVQSALKKEKKGEENKRLVMATRCLRSISLVRNIRRSCGASKCFIMFKSSPGDIYGMTNPVRRKSTYSEANHSTYRLVFASKLFLNARWNLVLVKRTDSRKCPITPWGRLQIEFLFEYRAFNRGDRLPSYQTLRGERKLNSASGIRYNPAHLIECPCPHTHPDRLGASRVAFQTTKMVAGYISTSSVTHTVRGLHVIASERVMLVVGVSWHWLGLCSNVISFDTS